MRLPIVLALGLSAVACKSSKPAARPTVVEVEAKAAPSPRPAPAHEPELTVELLSPGAAPREALRYEFGLEPSQWVVDLKEVIDIETDPPSATKKHIAMPTLRFLEERRPVRVSSDGALTADMRVLRVEVLDDPGTNPSVNDAIEKKLNTFAGAGGRVVLSARGLKEESTFSVPDEVPADLREIMQRSADLVRGLQRAFPVEPVGKGARWRSAQTLGGPLRIQTVRTVTLESFDDHGVTLSSAALVKGHSGDLPGTSSGWKVHVESSEGTFSGRSTIARTGEMGTGTSEGSAVTRMTLTKGDVSQRLVKTTHITMTVNHGAPSDAHMSR